MSEPITCADCSAAIIRSNGMAGTGYGIASDGARVCYACCGERDRKQMQSDGRGCLYLVGRSGREADKVANWPDSLSYRVEFWQKSRHAFGHPMITAYFKDEHGAWWSARNIGQHTKIAHCRRLAPSTLRRIGIR